jgi:hypothetical protein
MAYQTQQFALPFSFPILAPIPSTSILARLYAFPNLVPLSYL